MSTKPEDICPRPDFLPPQSTEPMAPPLYTAAVYRCRDTAQAEALLSGDSEGYVYVRDGHPNADLLAEKCRQLHSADRATICSSGMAALAAAALAHLSAGDEVVVSSQVYGRSLSLFSGELPRLGITATAVDTCDLHATRAACSKATKLLLVETITNPLLRVSDIAALAKVTHDAGALLLVDNTFAGPLVCRPLELGADLVMESLTKTMSGHSDVLLGLLCGREATWSRVPIAVATWGLSSAPFDCWLASRGLGTMALRVERAVANAQVAAEFLSHRPEISQALYPGLPNHPDHALARKQFAGRFGTIVTFTLRGGRPAVDAFIAASRNIPFSPSLGDLCTTLSHPETTSHRGLSAGERTALGIDGGTVRLSVGIESSEAILEALAVGLAAVR